MTLADKVVELKGKKAALMKKAKQTTKKLEADFHKQIGKTKRSTTEEVLSFRGRYYAVVGPILKKAKELEKAIELLGA